MSMDVQTSMRLPASLLQRADALIDSLQGSPSLAMMGKMTRSKVLRLALSEGLEQLEAQYKLRPTIPPLRPRDRLEGPKSVGQFSGAHKDLESIEATPVPHSTPATSQSPIHSVSMEED